MDEHQERGRSYKTITHHENVAGIRYLPSDPKQLHQVIKLSVYVSADCDWRVYGLNI